eukprot:GEMP01011969.1.p1 GENE.GEMP01011969.1~~GEMP01011969.1.p1  ORF type:complete len:192 (+),score=52.83 GEMP01011969.1:84-659(+)
MAATVANQQMMMPPLTNFGNFGLTMPNLNFQTRPLQYNTDLLGGGSPLQKPLMRPSLGSPFNQGLMLQPQGTPLQMPLMRPNLMGPFSNGGTHQQQQPQQPQHPPQQQPLGEIGNFAMPTQSFVYFPMPENKFMFFPDTKPMNDVVEQIPQLEVPVEVLTDDALPVDKPKTRDAKMKKKKSKKSSTSSGCC